MKINFGIMAVNPNDPRDSTRVLHFCGYENRPSKEDVEQLAKELEEDPEFQPGEPYVLIEAPSHVVQMFAEVIEREGGAEDGDEFELSPVLH